MDEQQIRQIIREVLRRVNEGETLDSNAESSLLPKAYFIFPKNWQRCETSQYIPMLKAAEGKYHRVVVLPERDANEDRFLSVGACTVTYYSDLCAPLEESVTIFPIPCRDLVLKTALCLSEDFEGAWIRKCLENGLRVYMKREDIMFTGKEPMAYRKKILSYYQDVKSYGICFLEDDNFRESVLKSGKKETKARSKTRFVTTEDLRVIPQNGEFQIHPGDVLTALAKDHIEKFGIRIVEE